MIVGAGGGADMNTDLARKAIGEYGEELAARRLADAGMTVLERNWRSGRAGEIDIVARDGDVLVVCEVKTRRDGPFQHPLAGVTPQKADRLRGLAEHWLHTHGGSPPGGVRIDVVAVLLPRRGAAVVEHVRGVA
ncbi:MULTISPECIES: YraN family protein [unclassified Streptomyces]|uniref:YraN family protein n=1 Tax=unclassified Streptomyces TaxID=2593676 RepID=UPI000DD59A2C|nr:MULTISPECIES: YraN family protein [unclassified Streptomyces]QZZ30486.1 YraN family protein [Streptomyces sp. ST1015]